MELDSLGDARVNGAAKTAVRGHYHNGLLSVGVGGSGKVVLVVEGCAKCERWNMHRKLKARREHKKYHMPRRK